MTDLCPRREKVSPTRSGPAMGDGDADEALTNPLVPGKVVEASARFTITSGSLASAQGSQPLLTNVPSHKTWLQLEFFSGMQMRPQMH